tara:strand:+ start:777 stop:1226 length:450 start_codon:yes stop_codon:yes gene_type:complete
MVSLIDIYNIKESTFNEVKSDRNLSRGNKSQNREKDFELVSGDPDPETGKITSKVVRKPSLSNMVKDLEAEIQDFEKLIDSKPKDIVLYNISEELKELFNKFRTHVRKKYPEEYKKVEEMSTLGTGTSFNAGVGMGYATPYAFKKKKKK